MNDLRLMIDVFLTLMLVEGVVKPVAIRASRWIMQQADTRVRWIPDWLYKNQHDDP